METNLMKNLCAALSGFVAFLAFALPFGIMGTLATMDSVAMASDPLSPNRLVFNFLDDPTFDENGDGEIDILDALPSIPLATDAIVYVGADSKADVFTVDGAGQPIINFASGAVNRLEDAVTLATELNVPLFLRGHFGTTDAIRIRGAVSISGYSQVPTIIHSLIDGGTTLINIKNRTTDVTIENVRLNEAVNLSVSMILFSGRNERIVVDDVQFTGRNIGAIYHTTAAIYMFRDWIKDVTISNCSITDFQYGINVVCGIRNLKILNNQFRNWTNFAVRIARLVSNDHLRTEGIDIIGNDFRKPKPGLYKSVIFVTRSESLLYIHDVRVIGNVIFSDGGAFHFHDIDSNATGDQLVLHGVSGFQITENMVFHGGENGITASTLSRNGVIARNVVHGNDTHGIIVGSGYYELSPSNVNKINIGDTIRGVTTGAQARVRSIRVHPSDGRTILGLDQIVGGKIFREELLNNVTTGMNGVATSSVVNRTKYVRVVENFVFGNGLDQAGNTPWTFGIFVQNADTVDILRNHIYNPNFDAVESTGGLQDQRLSIFLTNSRNVFVAPNNVFEMGKQTIQQALGMNASSWLRE